MNFEPQKFFIGLVDFFSILMPGALLTYLGKDWAARALLDRSSFPLDDAEAWIVFLFASYLLGHFAFLLSSALDDLIYDPLRKLTDWGLIGRLAEGRTLPTGELRALASWLFGRNADNAVMQANRLKVQALQLPGANSAINAFQWSKALLSKDHPDGLLAVQAFEAHSKFFRSFVVVLAALLAYLSMKQQWIEAAVCLGFLLLAFWRYVDQRFKATQQAYWLVITLESMKALPARARSPNQQARRLTHAGGVVFRKCGEVIEYLFVKRNNRAELILPRGQIEPAEDPKEAAVRGVREQTGYWARVIRWLDVATAEGDEHVTNVRFFLMEAAEEVEEATGKPWPREKGQRQWLTFARAKATQTAESVELLEGCDQLVVDAQKSKTVS